MTQKTRSKRLSERDYLLNMLIELSNNVDEKILNSRIYESLGWDRSRFLKVRDKLYEEGVLTYEGHYTKFVNFDADGRKKPTHKVFVSYSHRDEMDKDELLKHLSPLVRANVIETWHDRKMKPGDKIDQEISNSIRQSSIILLLVSADYLNSEYCYSQELSEAVKRHENGDAFVIPIILRHCYWDEAPFKLLLAATKDGKPVSDYRTKDEAFTEIVRGIKLRLG